MLSSGRELIRLSDMLKTFLSKILFQTQPTHYSLAVTVICNQSQKDGDLKLLSQSYLNENWTR
jgi:hypothetical protein